MKPKNYIFKTLIILLFFGLLSCSTEDRKIKKVLKEYALEEGTKYKLSKYQIVETILQSNLKDSISRSLISLKIEKKIITKDSVLLEHYIAQIKMCKIQKKETLSYLASSYNSIIDDWQEMIDDKKEDLIRRHNKIDKINSNIAKWETLIKNAETPIVYYIIRHYYVLDGKHEDNTVLLTTHYKML